MGMVPKNYITGKFSVGTETFSFTDAGRKELLGNREGDRKVSVRMYYPVFPDAVIGKEPAAIFSEKKAQAIRKAFHVPNMEPALSVAEYYEKAPPVPDEQFPLILFSHGYNSYIEANTYLCCALTSQGYIVASVGHAYEAVETDYEDGSFDLYDKKINKMMYNGMIRTLLAQRKLMKAKVSPEEAYEKFVAFQKEYAGCVNQRLHEWTKDMTSALREIKARYPKRIDFSNGVGVSGHSLGGTAAYWLCQNDPEIACGINIDGGVFGDYKGKTMTKPFFQICCKENYNLETRPLLMTSAPVHYAIFHDMKHMGFTDAKFYIPIKFLSGKMPADQMHKNLTDIHIRFFEKYLKKQNVFLEKEIIVK